METITTGDLIVEYVGELVRQQIADRREKTYERMGIGSSYLFRVDDDWVVDATKKGSMRYVPFSLVQSRPKISIIVDSSTILARPIA